MKNKIALLLTLSLLVAACTPTTPGPEASESDSAPAPESVEAESAMESAVDYTLDMAPFSFTPNVIEAEAGTTIRVKVVNKQGTHNFMLDELNVASKTINVGESDIVEIVIPEDASGNEYEFYCGVGNHRAMGMVGTLKVL